MNKAPRSAFLAQNPFPDPLTLGFFYREKMRAIHRVAPDGPVRSVLDVGGGQSGLASLLYPDATVTVLDLDPSFADAPCNQQPNISFVCGTATDLPFDEASFDAVTMFDLIEHVRDDEAVLQEAFRVLKPGGFLLLTTPNADWHYPSYSVLQPVCPDEQTLFEEWGHVRRGYTPASLNALAGRPATRTAPFISPITALCHDISFSNLPRRVRKLLCWGLAPLTWMGYWLHRPHHRGTETAYCWQKSPRSPAHREPTPSAITAPA